MFINQVKLKKTKEFAKEIGLDANEGLYGKRSEFKTDRRFQALFEK